MASEIRVNKINSRTGVGTITLSPTGVDFTGIATVATLKATTGIVTTFSATGNATVGGTLGVTGETTFSTHINLGDSDKAKFGASGDLEIYHNGTDSYVDTDVGDLRLRTTGSGDDIYLTAVDDVFIQVQGGETAAKFVGNGAVELNYDDTKKFETSAGGVTISGNMLPEANNTRDLGASGTAFANVYATTFTGALTGNSSTATEATNFTVTANNSTNETVYPVFVDGATGTQGAETDTGLTYNPSTGLLTATAFSGSAANLTALPITVTHTSYTGTAQITYSSNTITISATSNAYGTRTVSTSSPSGGANGDIWYQYS